MLEEEFWKLFGEIVGEKFVRFRGFIAFLTLFLDYRFIFIAFRNPL
jgi:hypothetical protein